MTHLNRTLQTLVCSLAAATTLFVAAPQQARADQVGTPFALFAPVLDGQLNVNTATTKQWELLPGIGPVTAKRIVAYREKHSFKEISHVMRVKGVGRKTFAAIKGYLSLKGETTLHVVGKAKGDKAGK